MKQPQKLIRRINNRLRIIRQETADMGLPAALQLLRDRLSSKWKGPKPEDSLISVRHRSLSHPLFLRRHSSDRYVLESVLTERVYAGFKLPVEPKLIVDCGANIGLVSAYFLSRFPDAHVVAVEPDEDNIRMCRMNLEPYGKRVTILRAAIWAEDVAMTVVRSRHECAHQVAPVSSGAVEIGAGEVRGMTMDSLLGQLPFARVDLLKIDIEGAEEQLFDGDYSKWLPRVDNLLIELHGPDAKEIFDEAMRGFSFQSDQYGELTACLGIKRR